jgi:hypothetical protein
MVLFCGCYSFRSGAAPTHLSTVFIEQVDDQSGFGQGTVRQDLRNLLVKRFRDDNTLRVVDGAGADSELDVTIATITNELQNVSGATLETVRRVTISVRATFNDNVKKRATYKDRTFTASNNYAVNRGAEGEAEAIRANLETISSQLLTEAVAQW